MTCNAGFADCNANRGDGCEVTVASDINHCGRCANRCSYPNGVAACVSGGCRLVSCLAGFANADGFSENGCELQVAHVGNGGISPFSGGTLRGLGEDPATGAISPSGMVSTTTSDFLWVVNVAESTVSKWDATARREIARYRVGLPAGECNGRCCWDNGCNMPSRVVIDGNGDAYVANRAFAMQGTVTKIAGDRADCVDRNGNGMIETSTSTTPLAYGVGATGVSSDECVLWTANVGAPDAVLRAIAIDRGDASRPNGYVWVAGFNNRTAYRLDPLDGRTLNTQAGLAIQPYGAVVTRDGRVWFSFSNTVQAVDSTTVVTGMPVALQAAIALPFGFYGPAADATGKLWFSTAGGTQVWGFDPTTMRTTRADLAGGTSLGATVDSAGNFVVSIQRAGRTDIARFPVSAFTPGASLGSPGIIPAAQITYIDGLANPTGAFPSAVGVDRRNDIWVASYTGNNRLMKFETAMGGMVREFTGAAAPNRTYSYSDFTGSVRRTSIPQGSYEQTFDMSCANPRPTTLRIDGNFPMGTIATVSVRTAATVAALGAATPVAIATLPPSASPYDLASAFAAARITPAQQLRVTMVLRAAESGAVPLVRGFDIRWTCP
jgi:streptogramin lyase